MKKKVRHYHTKKKLKVKGNIHFILFGSIFMLLLFPVSFFIQKEYTSNRMKSLVESSGSNKIRVLIVPGHEPTSGGAEFKDIKERDMAVELGEDLKSIMESDNKFEVFITRDEKSWNPIFNNYFNENWNDIFSWKEKSKSDYLSHITVGIASKLISIVRHNSTPKNPAIRLYGITRWANENKIDLMIHIHFNDDAIHRKNVPGKFSGFAIYVPSSGYQNSIESHAIAKKILEKLSLKSNTSNFYGEKGGIIDEPKLIATGANNTSNSPSVLIEYGYIYEHKFNDSNLMHEYLLDFAKETYKGVQNYFYEKNNLVN